MRVADEFVRGERARPRCHDRGVTTEVGAISSDRHVLDVAVGLPIHS